MAKFLVHWQLTAHEKGATLVERTLHWSVVAVVLDVTANDANCAAPIAVAERAREHRVAESVDDADTARVHRSPVARVELLRSAALRTLLAVLDALGAERLTAARKFERVLKQLVALAAAASRRANKRLVDKVLA